MRKLSNQEAYRELLDRECYSQNRVEVKINPINLLADIQLRDKVYRDLLNMLKLEGQHRNYLRSLGYRIKHRWTKENTRDLLITIGVIVVVFIILWFIYPRK